jgi:microcystin-dependent protein
MPLVNPTLPADGENADASDIVGPIQAILAILNGNIDQDNLADGGITLAKLGSTLQQMLIPTGSIHAYGGSAAPTGFLLCDGSAVSRATYSALYTTLGTSFGAGNGSTTFNLPDARSRFLVGAGAGTFIATFASTDVNATTDVITVPSNNSLYTGKPVVLTGTGVAPTGLAFSTTYYVINVSATTIKLATSVANAVAGTAIDITGAGSGTNTLTVSYTNNSVGAKGGEEIHALTQAEMPSHTHGIKVTANIAASGAAIGGQSGTFADTSSATGSSGAHNNLPPFQAVNYIIKH